MEKAGIIAFVKMRQVQTDDKYAMRGAELREAMMVRYMKNEQWVLLTFPPNEVLNVPS